MSYHEEVEAEKAKVDLTPWLEMSADEVHKYLCKLFDSYDWALDSRGKVTAKGCAYQDALIQLRDEKREYEQICEYMNNAGLKAYVDDVISIDRSETVWAECGCCVDSGGDYTVFLKDNTTVQFDRYGSQINKGPKSPKFSWLRNKK